MPKESEPTSDFEHDISDIPEKDDLGADALIAGGSNILPDKLEHRRAQLREAQKRWRERNPDLARQRVLQWREGLPNYKEWWRAYSRAWMRAYRERRKPQDTPLSPV